MKSQRTMDTKTSVEFIETVAPRMLQMARGKPLETALLIALQNAARTSLEVSQRIDANDITWAEAATRLVAVHEARSEAVAKLPSKHPWTPMMRAFIANRGAALAHLLRDRGQPAWADVVTDGDRRQMAVWGMLH